MTIPASLKNYAAQLGFPQSETMGRIFSLLYRTEDELRLAGALPGETSELSRRTGFSEEKVRGLIQVLESRGAVSHPMNKPDFHRFFPAMIELRDATVIAWKDAPQELFELWEKILIQETPPLIPILEQMKIPPMVRVIPVERSVAAQNTVLDYESARAMFAKAEVISAVPCACRTQARRLGKGKDCPAPATSVCMQTNGFARPILERGIGERLTNEEALRRLEQAEEAGLVHMVRNNIKTDMFMCNCCSCCCTGFHFFKNLHYAGTFAPSRFKVHLDESACTGCGVCGDRCQFDAIAIGNTAQISEGKCHGCGNCVIACPEGALNLVETFPPEHIRSK